MTARSEDVLAQSETVLSEDQLGSYGARNIGVLLQRLAPLIRDGDAAPILLINGKRIDVGLGVTGFPPEALERLDILRPEAAAKYGYASDKRIVNLTLKKHFVSTNGSLGTAVPALGGRGGKQFVTSRLSIDGPTYWNMQLRLSKDDSLVRSSRAGGGIAPVGPSVAEPEPYTLGLSRSMPAGPVLRSVDGVGYSGGTTLRGVPSFRMHATAIADRSAGGPISYATLLPSSRTASFSAGVSRPIGRFSGSLNLNAAAHDSAALQSYDAAGADASPCGSMGGPSRVHDAFSGVPIQPLSCVRVLRSRQIAKSVGVSGLVSGLVAGWQGSVGLGFSYVDAVNRASFDRNGRFADGARGSEASLSSFGHNSPSNLVSETRTSNSGLSGHMNLHKSPVTIPAGAISVNAFSNLGGTISSSRSVVRERLSSERAHAILGQLTTGFSVAFPIASSSHGVLSALGEMSAILSKSTTVSVGASRQSQYGTLVTWLPIANLQLNGSYSRSKIAPTRSLLTDPRVETFAQVYDYARQEAVSVTYVSGGNPALTAGGQDNIGVEGVLRPFGDQRLTVTSSYKRQSTDGGYASFPGLSPTIERSMPDRFLRSETGILLSIDARPIGIEQEVSERIDTGVAFTLSGSAGPSNEKSSTKSIRQPVQIVFSVEHALQLMDALILGGGSSIDQLTSGNTTPRQGVKAQFSAAVKGAGFTLNGGWQASIRVRDATSVDGSGDYGYRSLTKVDFALFVEPVQLMRTSFKSVIMNNTRISVDVQNLFNARRRIFLNAGKEIDDATNSRLDPLGRAMLLTIDTRW